MANTSSTIPKLLFLTYKVELSDRTWRKFEQAARGAYRIEFYNDSRADAFVARHCDASSAAPIGPTCSATCCSTTLEASILMYMLSGLEPAWAVGFTSFEPNNRCSLSQQIDVVPQKPLDDIFQPNDRAFAVLAHVPSHGMTVFNAILASPPRNPMMRHLAEGLLALQVNPLGQIVPWVGPVQDAYRAFVSHYARPSPGVAASSSRMSPQWTFFGSTSLAKGSRHPCPVRRDRYGACGW
eukprot:7385814-Prymnesium_polylepis.1